MKILDPKSAWARLWPYFKPYSGWVAAACAAGVLRFAVPLTVPWAFKIVVDEILTRPSEPANARDLFQIVGFLLCVHLVWILAVYARLYFTGLAGSRILQDLRGDLYAHIQKMPPGFFESKKTGEIVSRLMNEMTSVQQLLTNGVISAFMDVVSVVLAAVLMCALNLKLALVSFAAVPIYLLMSGIFMEKVRTASRGVHMQTEKISGDLHEKISGLAVTQSFLQEAREKEIFSDNCRGHMSSVMLNVKLQAIGLSLTGFLTVLTPIAVIGYGGWLVLHGYLTVGGLAAFYAYAGFVYMPLNRLMELNVVIGSAKASVERIFEILDTRPQVAESPFAIHLPAARGRVAFENISFSYKNGTPVFNGFDFELSPEECVALTGPSGAGKSTLIKLLMRFYDVTGGTIRLDGTDIRDLTLSSLRAQIAWVPQEPVLLSGSILENILYARPGARAAEAIDAAKAANAHEFILRLTRGYQTQAEEKGLALSAGEKQRVAIARAFLKRAPILVLDEPSSALDENSERLINESLKQLKQGKTTLIISHRLSMMEQAGRRVRLWKGRACEISKDSLPIL